jgi:predicted regulator of Ras-like GTPase activity (Roadblock/LC7/MglB family)
VATVVLLYEVQKKIEGFLENFLVKTGARHVFFAAKSGEVLVYSGSKKEKEISSITALLAGVFNATEELAKLIDEHQFKQFFLRGQAWNLFYQNLGPQFLLVVIFKKEALLGSVRVLTEKLAYKLKKELNKKTLKRSPYIFDMIEEKKLMEDLFKE